MKRTLNHYSQSFKQQVLDDNFIYFLCSKVFVSDFFMELSSCVPYSPFACPSVRRAERSPAKREKRPPPKRASSRPSVSFSGTAICYRSET